MNIVNKNNVIILVHCMFFMVLGIICASIIIYDINKDKKIGIIGSVIVLIMSSVFIFSPIVILIVILTKHIIEIYRKYKYGYQPDVFYEIN